MRRPAFPAVLAAALLGAPAAVHGASGDDIGATIKIVNVVKAEFEQDSRTLGTGDGVRQDEVVDVAPDAQGELKFNDDTKLALGPGSRLKLDRFVYDPDRSTGSIIMSLIKGTFRFMTGTAEKRAYQIKTPTASITVRGTIFDLYIEDGGLTWLLLHEGAVRLCNSRGKCREVTEPGKLIRVTEAGDVGIPVRWNGLPGHDSIPFENAFPFVVAPPSIDPSPVFTREAILADEPSGPTRADDGDRPSRRTGGTPRRRAEPEPQSTPTATGGTSRRQPPRGRQSGGSSGGTAGQGGNGGINVGIGISIGGGRGRSNDGGGNHDGADRGGGRHEGGNRSGGGNRGSNSGGGKGKGSGGSRTAKPSTKPAKGKGSKKGNTILPQVTF